uniref:Uncharacterized protein n=1 Tax=Arundo donax TaxID=35708 RepID=A0A0A9BPK8_ARUDO
MEEMMHSKFTISTLTL